MKKAAVIENGHAHGRRIHFPFHSRKHWCMAKKEENHRRVIYGFFERNSAPPGAEGKRIPG